jgi:hypothetical protein
MVVCCSRTYILCRYPWICAMRRLLSCSRSYVVFRCFWRSSSWKLNMIYDMCKFLIDIQCDRIMDLCYAKMFMNNTQINSWSSGALCHLLVIMKRTSGVTSWPWAYNNEFVIWRVSMKVSWSDDQLTNITHLTCWSSGCPMCRSFWRLSRSSADQLMTGYFALYNITHVISWPWLCAMCRCSWRWSRW